MNSTCTRLKMKRTISLIHQFKSVQLNLLIQMSFFFSLSLSLLLRVFMCTRKMFIKIEIVYVNRLYKNWILIWMYAHMACVGKAWENREWEISGEERKIPDFNKNKMKHNSNNNNNKESTESKILYNLCTNHMNFELWTRVYTYVCIAIIQY